VTDIIIMSDSFSPHLHEDGDVRCEEESDIGSHHGHYLILITGGLQS